MKKLMAVFGLILVLSVALAACSGGSSSGSANTLDITMSEYAFSPATYNVTAGSTVTVNLKNTGAVQHDFVVMTTPVTGTYTDANKANILFDSGPIDAGSSKTVTFTAPAAGTYQIICTQSGHFEQGMVASLVSK
jgi:plastocyanin